MMRLIQSSSSIYGFLGNCGCILFTRIISSSGLMCCFLGTTNVAGLSKFLIKDSMRLKDIDNKVVEQMLYEQHKAKNSLLKL